MKSQHFLFGNSIIFIWEDLAGLINGTNQRDAKWTQSIAACPVKPGFSFNWGGDKEFVLETKAKLGAKAIGRHGVMNIEGSELKERQRVVS